MMYEEERFLCCILDAVRDEQVCDDRRRFLRSVRLERHRRVAGIARIGPQIARLCQFARNTTRAMMAQRGQLTSNFYTNDLVTRLAKEDGAPKNASVRASRTASVAHSPWLRQNSALNPPRLCVIGQVYGWKNSVVTDEAVTESVWTW